MPQTQTPTKGMYFLRLFALACTTFSGVYFLASVFVLAAAYNHTERHFPLFITTQDFVKTVVAGVFFLSCAIAYIVLAKKTMRNKS
jgi:hypothetical protein